MAGCCESLAEAVSALGALGAVVAQTDFPPMLTVDVPAAVPLLPNPQPQPQTPNTVDFPRKFVRFVG